MDIWTQILNLTSQLVTPVWNDLLIYLPLVFIVLVLMTFVLLVWMWSRNASLNRGRVPRPVAAAAPEGVHMPGPSPWPLIVPIGLMLVFFSLAVGFGGGVIVPALIVAGVGVAILGAVGWYRDAGREWRRVDAGGHATLHAGTATAIALPLPSGPPPGVHLPGPSPWPFFAPLGLMFVFAGLVFGPFLLIGGAIMAMIAAVGWYLDAGREYRQVEEGHAPEPATRDPEKAFPKRLVPVYLGIAGITVLLTLTPWFISFLPGTVEQGGGGAAEVPTSTPLLSASAATHFDQDHLTVVANQPIKLTFENQQAGVPHDVAIYDSPAHSKELFQGEIVTGVTTVVYDVKPLPPGTYFYTCIVHPPMTGTLVSK